MDRRRRSRSRSLQRRQVCFVLLLEAVGRTDGKLLAQGKSVIV